MTTLGTSEHSKKKKKRKKKKKKRSDLNDTNWSNKSYFLDSENDKIRKKMLEFMLTSVKAD